MGSKFVIADPGLCIGCQTCMAGCLLKHSVPGDVPKPRLNLITTLTISAPSCATIVPTRPVWHRAPKARYTSMAPAWPSSRSAASVAAAACSPVPMEPWRSSPRRARPSSAALRWKRSQASLVKCDLCYDREGGPACVEACPTGGLMVVDEEELADRQRQRRMRAAVASGAFSSVPLNTDLN